MISGDFFLPARESLKALEDGKGTVGYRRGGGGGGGAVVLQQEVVGVEPLPQHQGTV